MLFDSAGKAVNFKVGRKMFKQDLELRLEIVTILLTLTR